MVKCTLDNGDIIELCNNKVIIRIEHSDGYGCFRWNDYTGNRYTVRDSFETQECYKRYNMYTPVLLDNIKNLPLDKERAFKLFCAFKSIEHFNYIFDAETVKFLLTKDFKILILEVTKWLEGDNQILYRKEDVIKITDISSLYQAQFNLITEKNW